MSRSIGSVEQLPSGRFRVRFSTAGGHRPSLGAFATRADAETAMQRVLAAGSAETIAPVSGIPLADGGVYFIQPRGGDVVKIGFTKCVSDRLAKLQTAHQAPLDVLAVVPGDIATERSLHTRFRCYRVRGEWFRFEGGLRDYVGRVGAVTRATR